VAFIINLNERF